MNKLFRTLAVKNTAFIIALLSMMLTACNRAPLDTLPATPTLHAATRTQPVPTVAASATVEAATATATPITASTPAGEIASSCGLLPVIVPTMPAVIPGYTELDPDTGLHMTGLVQQLDLASYRLEVSGKVDHHLSLSYDELRCMPKIQSKSILDCPGYFEDIATWDGVPLKYILDLAGVQADAKEVQFVGADKYSSYLSLSEARLDKNYLAYEWEGQPLPILHGFPLRGVFPGLYGNKWVKWLIKIVVE
jgi:DMSO/TMAO reductase YedYZ molybdopterin-dependent catalytic subunit